jgi:hypothetical protein
LVRSATPGDQRCPPIKASPWESPKILSLAQLFKNLF